MLLGSCLMVAGAGMYIFGVQQIAPIVFTVGVGAFVAMQAQQTYQGNSFTIRRLCRILGMGMLFFCLSALLMIENAYHILLPYFTAHGVNGYNAYLNYIHNNWVVLLLAAAVIELYSTHRISSELAKEQKKL